MCSKWNRKFKSKCFQYDNRNKWIRNTKHTSCECECKFDSRKCSPNQKWNNSNCWCNCKNLKEHYVCKWDYRGNKNCSKKYYFNKFLYFTHLLLTNIALLIPVNIYHYLIKYQVKQKHLLPSHYIINKLKEIGY